MEIRINLDVVMARRKIGSAELAERVGITPANLSILKNGKAKAVRFTTLMALCHELQCQPGDLLEFVDDENDSPLPPRGEAGGPCLFTGNKKRSRVGRPTRLHVI